MTTHEILLAAQAAKLPLALADTDTTKTLRWKPWQLPWWKTVMQFWPLTSRIWPPHAGASAM